jgi:hypothetical protein
MADQRNCRNTGIAYIARNFKKNVGNEENDQCNIVTVACEFKVLGEPEHFRVGNVHTILVSREAYKHFRILPI